MKFILIGLFLLGSSSSFSGTLALDQYSATFDFSEENSKLLFGFLEKGKIQNPRLFFVEIVEFAKLVDDKLCGKKVKKVFESKKTLLPTYVCKSSLGKYYGNEAKFDFENAKAAGNLVKVVTTIHGKNLGCAKTAKTDAAGKNFICAISIMDSGKTESNAPFINF